MTIGLHISVHDYPDSLSKTFALFKINSQFNLEFLINA